MNQPILQQVLEYAKDMDESAIEKYITRVRIFLHKMKPDQKIPISSLASDSTRQLFIEVSKIIIDEVEWRPWEFNSEYTWIRRVDLGGFESKELTTIKFYNH